MKLISLKSICFLLLILTSFSLMSFELDESLDSGRKFWGTQLSWGACGRNTDGTEGCFRGQYSTYYVFWFASGDSEPTGVTEPCDCPK